MIYSYTSAGMVKISNTNNRKCVQGLKASGTFHTLLLAIQSGTIPMQKNLAFSYIFNYIVIIWFSNLTAGIYSRDMKLMLTQKPVRNVLTALFLPKTWNDLSIL